MQELLEQWRVRAALFREHAHGPTAQTYERCADELERLLATEEEQLLTLRPGVGAFGLQCGPPRATGPRWEDSQRRSSERSPSAAF